MATAISKRLLFPPLVPQSIPAFDAVTDKTFKVFFKKSPANFAGGLNGNLQGENFEHIQVSIVRLDNNRNAISTQRDYNKSGYIMATVSKRDGVVESLDDYKTKVEVNKVYKVYGRDPQSPYCVVLPTLNYSFFDLNILYKLQIRLGAETLTNPKDITYSEILEMEKNLVVSEWSGVTTMKPIEPPAFGITGFNNTESKFEPTDEDPVNTIATSNFSYVGYYKYNTIVAEEVENTRMLPQSTMEKKYRLDSGQEVLSEYRYVLKTGNGATVLDDSGYKKISEHERKNINHTFAYTTKDREKYLIEFHIKTFNGFTDYKTYKLEPRYKRLNASSALIKVDSEEYRARMKLDIKAKQIVFEPSVDPNYPNETGSLDVSGVKDLYSIANSKPKGDPMMDIAPEEVEKIKTTHVLFNGTSTTNKSFFLTNESNRDRWVCEIKASGWIPYNSREVALLNPYIVIQNDVEGVSRNVYYTTLELICYKKCINCYKLSTEIIVDPVTGNKKFKPDTSEQPQIILEVVKRSYRKDRGEEPKLLATQTTKSIQMVKDRSIIVPYYRWFGGSKLKTATIKKEEGMVTPNWTIGPNGRPTRPDYIDKTYFQSMPFKKYEPPTSKTKTDIDHQAELELYIYLSNYDGTIGFHVAETEYKHEQSNRNFYITEHPVMKNFFENRENYVREKGGIT